MIDLLFKIIKGNNKYFWFILYKNKRKNDITIFIYNLYLWNKKILKEILIYPLK